MQTNLKGLVDAGLSGAATFNIVDYNGLKASLPTTLMSSSAVNLTLYPDELDMNSTQTLVESFKVNLKLDLTNLFPSSGTPSSSGNALLDMMGLNLNDPMSMLQKPLTYIAGGLTTLSDLNITLNGTDLSGLMNG